MHNITAGGHNGQTLPPLQEDGRTHPSIVEVNELKSLKGSGETRGRANSF